MHSWKSDSSFSLESVDQTCAGNRVRLNRRSYCADNTAMPGWRLTTDVALFPTSPRGRIGTDAPRRSGDNTRPVWGDPDAAVAAVQINSDARLSVRLNCSPTIIGQFGGLSDKDQS